MKKENGGVRREVRREENSWAFGCGGVDNLSGGSDEMKERKNVNQLG